MNTPPRVMLLIDADNVSADVIEQAVQRTMTEHGAIHVRRAYCNAETAMKQQALFKRLSVRPMVNLSSGKNSTDIALAVDAMDLAVAERPDIAVLVSSDSDFAPLVIRLREKGCRVCGIGQQGKTGDDTVAIYDSFVDLQHHQAPKAAVAVAKTAAKRAPRRAKAVAPKAAPPAPVLPDEVIRILDAVAELGMGNKVELNVAAERLRAEKLLSKSASSPKLFKKYPELFLLTPEKTPNKVQYVGPMPS
ncbi:NYN domain-containing protein [Variovorax sp. J2P1-59]|uniref:NYN domain-containing protein n=1 Tax=Variovorax flavidus TaxID=3053501 RepID=UPI002576ABBC|nr:NYN domain-containing protein [Variovorax sp. J2P1-59]MDM0078047.1 NYN domain-containing protein [Variovorax sp. J2P1-59]